MWWSGGRNVGTTKGMRRCEGECDVSPGAVSYASCHSWRTTRLRVSPVAGVDGTRSSDEIGKVRNEGAFSIGPPNQAPNHAHAPMRAHFSHGSRAVCPCPHHFLFGDLYCLCGRRLRPNGIKGGLSE